MTNKKKNKSKAIPFLLAIVLIVAFIGGLAYFMSKQPYSKVLVSVNGDPITENDLDETYERMPEQYRLFFSREDILDQMINQKLLLQEAKTQGAVADSAMVDERVNQIRTQFASEEEFLDALKEQNITLKEVREQLRDQASIALLLNKSIYGRIQVAEKDINDDYISQIEQFTADQDERRAAHILLLTEEEAIEVRQLLLNGSDFGRLAATRSTDPSAVVNQGHLGIFGRGSMVPEFEKAAFSLDVGEISAPVKTQYGYHIIQRLPGIIPLSEVKESIALKVREQKQKNATSDFINGLRAKTTIKRFDLLHEFEETGEQVCLEDGKPVIRRYLSSSCESCGKAELAFLNAVSDYDVVVKEYELDTGDDLTTDAKERALPSDEFNILKRFNPQGAVPAYLFGCSHLRIGNAYEDNIAGEERIFRETLDELQ